MSFYAIVLFFHITGALGLFVGLGLEWLIVHNLMRVNSNSQAVQWLALFKILPPIFLSSGILILISGVYMAVEIWGFNSWIISGLVLYLFLAAFGGIIVSRKVGQIKSELETESDNLSESILVRLKSPLISESLKIRILLALSIIFIMTVKPDWTVTLMVICIALLTGFLLAKILK
jgi:ABC-type multidrug transport system fused ATPase/permease subunit